MAAFKVNKSAAPNLAEAPRVVVPGSGVYREIDLSALSADLDLTVDPADGTTPFGPANAIEFLSSGKVEIVGPDDVATVIGSVAAKASGWSADGLLIKSIKYGANTTVTGVGVRW